jgi:hypothetical protein
VHSNDHNNDSNNKHMTGKMKAVFWVVKMLRPLNRLYRLLTEDAEDSAATVFRIILHGTSTVAAATPIQVVEATASRISRPKCNQCWPG